MINDWLVSNFSALTVVFYLQNITDLIVGAVGAEVGVGMMTIKVLIYITHA